MDAGAAIEAAVDRVPADPGSRTPDLGGSVSTSDFGALVSATIGDAPPVAAPVG